MEYKPPIPKHCGNCPTYNSIPQMTFRFFQWNAGEVTECRDNLIHLVYVTKGKIQVTGGQIVDKFIIDENHFVLLAKGQKFKLTAEEYSEAVIQDVIYPCYVCEQRTFDITYAKLDKPVQVDPFGQD